MAAESNRYRITIEQIGFRYALILAGANVGFFLLMALFGLEHLTWLRFVNLVFIFLVVYKGMQYFKHHSLNPWTYFKGMGLGAFIVLIGAVIFSVFLGLYSMLDSSFVDAVNSTARVGYDFNPVFIGIIVFLETVIYGFILVFTAMQRLKTSHMKDAVHI